MSTNVSETNMSTIETNTSRNVSKALAQKTGRKFFSVKDDYYYINGYYTVGKILGIDTHTINVAKMNVEFIKDYFAVVSKKEKDDKKKADDKPKTENKDSASYNSFKYYKYIRNAQKEIIGMVEFGTLDFDFGQIIMFGPKAPGYGKGGGSNIISKHATLDFMIKSDKKDILDAFAHFYNMFQASTIFAMYPENAKNFDNDVITFSVEECCKTYALRKDPAKEHVHVKIICATSKGFIDFPKDQLDYINDYSPFFVKTPHVDFPYLDSKYDSKEAMKKSIDGYKSKIDGLGSVFFNVEFLPRVKGSCLMKAGTPLNVVEQMKTTDYWNFSNVIVGLFNEHGKIVAADINPPGMREKKFIKWTDTDQGTRNGIVRNGTDGKGILGDTSEIINDWKKLKQFSPNHCALPIPRMVTGQEGQNEKVPPLKGTCIATVDRIGFGKTFRIHFFPRCILILPNENKVSNPMGNNIPAANVEELSKGKSVFEDKNEAFGYDQENGDEQCNDDDQCDENDQSPFANACGG